MYDYTANLYDELSIKVGDIINIHDKQADGWWLGELRGQVGIFPATYVEEEESQAWYFCKTSYAIKNHINRLGGTESIWNVKDEIAQKKNLRSDSPSKGPVTLKAVASELKQKLAY